MTKKILAKIISAIVILVLVSSFLFIVLTATFKPQQVALIIQSDKTAWDNIIPWQQIKIQLNKKIKTTTESLTINKKVIIILILIILAIIFLNKKIRRDNEDNNKSI